MKNIIASISIVLMLLLAGCASNDKQPDPLAPYRDLSAQQIYQHSNALLVQDNLPDAISGFEALNALYPFGKYAQKGLKDLIYAYYKNDEVVSSLSASKRYIQLYPQSKFVDYAYYMHGFVNYSREQSWVQTKLHLDPAPRDLTSYKEAFNDFRTLIQFFPHSQYAPDARKRMIFIRNILAKHQLEIAQYYYSRRAYTAAIARANQVVRHFVGAPEVPEALQLLVKIYQKLELPKMVAQTQVVLRRNYPHLPAPEKR